MRQSRWWVHTAIVVSTTTAFMAVAAWQSMPWWEYAFLSDDSPVSWLSSALLLANTGVALTLTLSRGLPMPLGSLLALSLAVLAIDEQFLLHERFKESVVPSLGNAPTFVVGVGGVVLLVLLNRTVKSRPALALLLSAIVVGLFALWVDLGHPPAVWGRLEEGYEVLAESLFLSGLLEISRGSGALNLSAVSQE